MSAETDSMRESLALLAGKEEQFASLLRDDLKQSHPEVIPAYEKMPADGVKTALERFSVNTGEGEPSSDPEPEVVDLADSIMKVFARTLGRAAWKPHMALAWNSSLRRDGETLLAELNELQ